MTRHTVTNVAAIAALALTMGVLSYLAQIFLG